MRGWALGIGLGVMLLAVPLAAEAQPARAPQIGIVWGTFSEASQVLFEPLRDGLRELGYVEGRSIFFEQRWAEGRPERFPALMDSLVRLKVDAIVVPVNPIITAAQRATTTIPIIMLFAVDPVGAGFVASLSKPGGNVTGLSIGQGPETLAKNLEFPKEASPHVSTLIVLYNPASPGIGRYLRDIEATARGRGIALQRQDLPSIREIDTVLAAIRVDNRSALLVFPDPATFAGRGQIAQWAVKNRLPSSATMGEFAQSGGLLAYTASTRDLSRRAAAYIDKILKGAKPADLPVEQPTKFELVINLKTAKALGLTIPPSLLQRADQVIE